jgi:hypothetical protein
MDISKKHRAQEIEMTYRIALTNGSSVEMIGFSVPADLVQEYRDAAREITQRNPGDSRWVVVTEEV